jgi:hypothetical protein
MGGTWVEGNRVNRAPEGIPGASYLLERWGQQLSLGTSTHSLAFTLLWSEGVSSQEVEFSLLPRSGGHVTLAAEAAIWDLLGDWVSGAD